MDLGLEDHLAAARRRDAHATRARINAHLGRLHIQELGQHSWVRTSTPGAIAHLFSTSHDARFLGATGSEVSSGQSGLQGPTPHKPPHSLGRTLTPQRPLYTVSFVGCVSF